MMNGCGGGVLCGRGGDGSPESAPQRFNAELKSGNGWPTEQTEYSEKGMQSHSLRRCATRAGGLIRLSVCPVR